MKPIDKLISATETGDLTKISAADVKNATGKHVFPYIYSVVRFGSLDAAKKLHGALLPKWDWSSHGNGQCCLWAPGSVDDQNRGVVEVEVDDLPARAWLLAILKVYRTREATP